MWTCYCILITFISSHLSLKSQLTLGKLLQRFHAYFRNIQIDFGNERSNATTRFSLLPLPKWICEETFNFTESCFKCISDCSEGRLCTLADIVQKVSWGIDDGFQLRQIRFSLVDLILRNRVFLLRRISIEVSHYYLNRKIIDSLLSPSATIF